MFEWIDPFAELDDMARYIRDREEENRERLHWALSEISRHRSVLDRAFHDSLHRHILDLQPATSASIMDTSIMAILSRKTF